MPTLAETRCTFVLKCSLRYLFYAIMDGLVSCFAYFNHNMQDAFEN